jgi:hypothetical protein
MKVTTPIGVIPAPGVELVSLTVGDSNQLMVAGGRPGR